MEVFHKVIVVGVPNLRSRAEFFSPVCRKMQNWGCLHRQRARYKRKRMHTSSNALPRNQGRSQRRWMQLCRALQNLAEYGGARVPC